MKKKKTLLIVIIILIALIIAIVGVATVLYLRTDMFKSNKQLFAKYAFADNNLPELLKTDVIQDQKQFKKTNSYTSDGKIVIEMQKDDEEKKVEINTNTQYNKENKRMYTEAILKNGEEDLVKFSYINSDDVYGVKCDNIYENYIGIRNADLKQFAESMGLTEEMVAQIPDSIQLDNIQNMQLLTEKERQYLIDTYSTIIADSIPKENYGKTSSYITIENKDYQANGYVLTLNKTEILKILNNVSIKAKEDYNTLTIFRNVLFAIGMQEKQIEQINFQSEIQKIMDIIQENLEEEFKISIIVYQSEGKNIRTEIEINEQASIIFDIVNDTQTNQKVIITIKPANSNNKIEMKLEKTTSNSGITHNASILVEQNNSSYEILANTMLGNVTSGSIHNVSNVSINDYNNNTIEISYDKTTNVAKQELEIQELKNSNTVIVNNYPIEQLEPFFNSIGETANSVLEDVDEQLDLKLVNRDIEDNLKNIHAIAGTILTVANANELEPIGNIIGICTITIINETINEQLKEYENIENSLNINSLEN